MVVYDVTDPSPIIDVFDEYKAQYNPNGSRNLREDVLGMTAGTIVGAAALGAVGALVGGPLGAAVGGAAGAVGAQSLERPSSIGNKPVGRPGRQDRLRV